MSRGRWLSKAAVLWAMYEAPDVPSHLLAALVAVAMHTGEDGKGAYVSAATVAQLTRKTERSAKRDLAELRGLGLLLPGNQRIVAHISADKRPFVYDLPMPRGDAHDTPLNGHGVTHTSSRGDVHGQDGVTYTSPKEILKRSRRSARANAGAAARAKTQPCDRDGATMHSEACRRGQSSKCGVDWCACQCHARTPGPVQPDCFYCGAMGHLVATCPSRIRAGGS